MRKGKILAICLLVITFSLTIGSIVLANNMVAVTSDSNSNVVMELNNAKKAQAQAKNEATIYRQALKNMKVNYWITFLVILSLAFLGMFMVVAFINSRKKLKEKTAGNNIQQ